MIKTRNSKPIKRRPAIAMIELIFAIVIIGIVLMSVPNLIDRAAKSGYTSLQQEAIAVASSHISLILAMQWDEEDTNTSRKGPILQVSSGNSKLAARPGAFQRNYIGSGGPYAASSIGSDLNDLDDIDDFHGTTISLRNFEDIDTESGDLIDLKIEIATTIDYIDDNLSSGDYNTSSAIVYNFDPAAATPTTNIKAISTTLTTNSTAEELDKEITLRAFSCNIGNFEPAATAGDI